MGNTQKSAPKIPKTRSSNQSLDMHQSRAELGPHPRLCVGSCRMPPGVSSCFRRADRNGMSDVHFGRPHGCLCCQEIAVTEKARCFIKHNKNSVCKISQVLLKLRPSPVKYKGHLKERMKWLLKTQAGVKGS